MNALKRLTSRRRTLLMCALAVISGLNFWTNSFVPSLSGMTYGFPAYYTAARLVIEGRWSDRVYDDAWFGAQVLAQTDGRVSDLLSYNPPAASLLLVPLAWLDLGSARAGWAVFKLVLLAASLWLILNALPQLAVRAGWIALVFSFGPLREDFRVGQMYVPLLFLFALTFWSMPRRRTAFTGIALGVAAVTKLSGGPVWLTLAARGRWRDVGMSAVSGAALVAISMIVTGAPGWSAFLAELPAHLTATRWASQVAFQATPSFFQRLFVADARWNPQPLWNWPWLAVALSIGLIGAALMLTIWRSRRADWDLAFGSAVALGVLVFPLAEEYHYTLFLLPLAVMVSRIARKPFDARDGVWLVAVLLLLAVPWPYKNMGQDGWSALLSYPRLYGGWLVWGWLIAHMPIAPQAR